MKIIDWKLQWEEKEKFVWFLKREILLEKYFSGNRFKPRKMSLNFNGLSNEKHRRDFDDFQWKFRKRGENKIEIEIEEHPFWWKIFSKKCWTT